MNFFQNLMTAFLYLFWARDLWSVCGNYGSATTGKRGSMTVGASCVETPDINCDSIISAKQRPLRFVRVDECAISRRPLFSENFSAFFWVLLSVYLGIKCSEQRMACFFNVSFSQKDGHFQCRELHSVHELWCIILKNTSKKLRNTFDLTLRKKAASNCFFSIILCGKI